MKFQLENRQQEIKNKQTEVVKNQETTMRLEHAMREEKARTDKAAKVRREQPSHSPPHFHNLAYFLTPCGDQSYGMQECDALTYKVMKLTTELEEHLHSNVQLQSEAAQRQMELKMKDDEITGIKSDVAKMARLREGLTKKVLPCSRQWYGLCC